MIFLTLINIVLIVVPKKKITEQLNARMSQT